MKLKFTVLILFLNTITTFSETLKISFGQPEDNATFKSVQVLLGELSKIVEDVDFELTSLPNDRCRYSLLEGLTDGDMFRTDYAYNGTDAIRIDVQLMKNPYMAYVNYRTIDFSIEDLSNKSVIINRGDAAAKNYVLKNSLKYSIVNNPIQSFNMLLSERADVVIQSYALTVLLKNYSLDQNIRVILPPLFYEDTYMFINKKNIHLKDKLEKGFLQLAKSGIIDDILSIYTLQ